MWFPALGFLSKNEMSVFDGLIKFRFYSNIRFGFQRNNLLLWVNVQNTVVGVSLASLLATNRALHGHYREKLALHLNMCYIHFIKMSVNYFRKGCCCPPAPMVSHQVYSYFRFHTVSYP